MISKFQICYIMYVYIDNIISTLHIAYIISEAINQFAGAVLMADATCPASLCHPSLQASKIQDFTDCMFHLVLVLRVKKKTSNECMIMYANTTSTEGGLYTKSYSVK